ncbi:MAG: HAD-IA family hydrolase [Candidatus Anstonellales archaeon]
MHKNSDVLVAFDFDETLASPRSISVLGEILNKKDKLESILLTSDVNKRFILLANEMLGNDPEIFQKAADLMSPEPYALELLEEFRKRKYIIGIISDGYYELIKHFEKKLIKFDFVIAHKFELLNGKLSKVILAVENYSNDWKGRILVDLKNKYNCQKTIAIGDNLQDLSMLRVADISIAYKPKVEILKEFSKITIYNYKEILDNLDLY